MKDMDLKTIITGCVKEICHYSQMQVFATSYYQKNLFQMQIDEVTDGLLQVCQNHILQASEQLVPMETIQQLIEVSPAPEANQQSPVLSSKEQRNSSEEQRSFTPEELAFYDGSSGRAAYVAVNDQVYDVTMLIEWAGGTHFGHYAGRNVSEEFDSYHQGNTEVLRRVPKIGILKK